MSQALDDSTLYQLGKRLAGLSATQARMNTLHGSLIMLQKTQAFFLPGDAKYDLLEELIARQQVKYLSAKIQWREAGDQYGKIMEELARRDTFTDI